VTLAWPSDVARPAAQGEVWGRRMVLGLCVAIVLTFSQGWEVPLTGPNGDPEASGLIRTLFFPGYGAALILALAAPWTTLKAAARQPLIWLLVGYAFTSTLWSVDPDTTVRRSIALLFTTLAALVLSARYDWPEMLEVLATAYAVVVVCCFFLGLFVPSYGRMTKIFPGAWSGVWRDKNALGDNMAMIFIIFSATAILNPQRRLRWVLFALSAVVLILLSTSKTSLATVVIGSGSLAFVWLVKRGGAISVAAVFAGVAALLALALAIIFASDVFFALLGKDATFTGRTSIWSAVLRLIDKRPWTGYGYAAIWTDETGWGPLAWIIKWSKFRPHHAHNSWLETWLALGIPGLVLWATLFLETWGRGLWAVFTRGCGYFALPFLAVYSLTIMTESVAFIYNDQLWLIFAAMAFRLARPDGAVVRSARSP